MDELLKTEPFRQLTDQEILEIVRAELLSKGIGLLPQELVAIDMVKDAFDANKIKLSEVEHLQKIVKEYKDNLLTKLEAIEVVLNEIRDTSSQVVPSGTTIH